MTGTARGRGAIGAAAHPGRRRPRDARRLIARTFDIAIALTGLLALFLVIAGARAPSFGGHIDPAAMSSDGGYAFTFAPGFDAHWPYAVPSHPASTLALGDVRVMEDGRPVGALEPNHASIRENGRGAYNFWDGTLWFSSTDGTDPRVNARDYGVRVRARLDPTAALVRDWGTALCVILALFRVGAALGTRAAPGLARAAGTVSGPARRILARVPLTWLDGYWLAGALVLGVFAWQTLARPMPLNFGIDSFGFVYPGILWDAGQSVAGQSTRDLGYPALAALALALGSLGRLPILQLIVVMAGLVCALAVLARALGHTVDRLAATTGLPTAITGFFACAVATGYLALMFSHDLFVEDIYSVMGEAPHVLPTAAALLLFVASWTARTPRWRLACGAAAVAAAYLSTMVKPHTSLVAVLCAGSFVFNALRAVRVVRSPAVLVACALSAGVVGGVRLADAWVTQPGADFGPKTVFCNHLDVVLPAFDGFTPERARVAALMRDTVRTPNGWVLMGFNGDGCMYDVAMTEAIGAVAKADKLSPAAWETREFVKAVAARPGAYARDVLRQVTYYMGHPIDDVDHREQSVMPDDVWERFAPFVGRIRMSRDQFLADVGNWVPEAYPRLSALAKAILRGIGATFAIVTLGGTGLALATVLAVRGKGDLRPEAALLATAAFTLAFMMTTALSHTFDIGRYLTDLLPFSLLWWVMGVTYLLHALAVASALALRRDGRAPALAERRGAEAPFRG